MWCVFLFKQKTAYEMRISDWSSDVCSSDLNGIAAVVAGAVGDIGLEFGRRAAPGGGRIWKAGGKRRIAGERIVHRSTKRLDDGEIGQLGPAADVEAFADRIEIGRAHV